MSDRMQRLSSLANRLYRGEAGVDVVGRRKIWFSVAGAVLLVAISAFIIRGGFKLGIEFNGGNEFKVPASVGTLDRAESAIASALGAVDTGEPARVVSAQELRGQGEAVYLIRTSEIDAADALEVKEVAAGSLGIQASQISDSLVSSAWGGQVTRQALIGLFVFLVLVVAYLAFRFEWRMAVAAVASLLLDLALTAAVYLIVGFEVTPSTVIGFLTILGFALYDVVVVFDKVQENTRGITSTSRQTYGEAANLAVNQTLMRSINTGLVALLPVGGLLFIGAGLLGAGTLKDLGLVLFFGMGAAVYSSIFFATPVLVTLKEREPHLQAQAKRVMAKRAAEAKGGVAAPARPRAKAAKAAVGRPAAPADDEEDAPVAPVAVTSSSKVPGAAPKPGAKPGARKRPGSRPGRPGAKRR
jgi:preprotein translocase subunit SecF